MQLQGGIDTTVLKLTNFLPMTLSSGTTPITLSPMLVLLLMVMVRWWYNYGAGDDYENDYGTDRYFYKLSIHIPVREALPDKIICSFFTLFKRPLTPLPPLILNNHIVDF